MITMMIVIVIAMIVVSELLLEGRRGGEINKVKYAPASVLEVSEVHGERCGDHACWLPTRRAMSQRHSCPCQAAG